jgi:hypothetical protein
MSSRSCGASEVVVWLIRTHTTRAEEDAYNTWLQQRHLTAVPVGFPDLTRVRLNKSACQGT